MDLLVKVLCSQYRSTLNLLYGVVGTAKFAVR